MDTHASVARALAAAFAAGEFSVDELVDQASRVLGRRWRWLRPFAQRITANFAGHVRPRQNALTKFIIGDPGFVRAAEKYELEVSDWLSAKPVMSPSGPADAWPVVSLRTAGEVADWLGVTAGELEWFADRRRLEPRQCRPQLRHYHYRLLAKGFGQIRLIEAPKPRLKAIQRRLLGEILNHIPPHAAAHGFRRERSTKTFTAPHVAKRVVLKLDLQDFFPSISAAQIQALFRAVGYAEEVADVLAGLCTNSAPAELFADELIPFDRQRHYQCRIYMQPHLPQGAPTSPAIANLCAYRLDCRLTGLARAANAAYTRYADDLAFSGEHAFERVAKRFQLHVFATVIEEGFSVHHRKTRIMRQGVRQRLAGLIVNQRANIQRSDYDCLKAILTNCIHHGPGSQNRSGQQNFRAYLKGRVTFVELINPARGSRLRKLFEQIAW